MLPSDFSLDLGGPLYQLYVRSRILKPPLDLLRWRVVVITAVAWLPLLVLSVIGGNATGGVVDFPSCATRDSRTVSHGASHPDRRRARRPSAYPPAVRELRPVPFGLDAVTRIAALMNAPLLPLTLTVVPLEERVTRMVKVLL